MTQSDPFHDRLLEIVLKLPGAYEDRPWGSVHCKVAGKIFVGWSRNDRGEMEIGIRVPLELQSMLVTSDPRFSIAKYSGKYGGVDMRLGPKPNWAEVEQFIVESYRIIAPKKLVKELDARAGEGGGAGAGKAAPGKAGPKQGAARVEVAKKTAAKKTAAKKATTTKVPAVEKTAVKKSATKAPAAKKSAAEKPAAKVAAAKKTAAKRATTTKATARA